MNKSEIVSAIAAKTNLSKAKVDEVVSCFFETVKTAVKRKKSVKLIGFGTFSSSERKARTGRNPQTGDKIQIPFCHYPRFKPGKEFKDYLN